MENGQNRTFIVVVKTEHYCGDPSPSGDQGQEARIDRNQRAISAFRQDVANLLTKYNRSQSEVTFEQEYPVLETILLSCTIEMARAIFSIDGIIAMTENGYVEPVEEGDEGEQYLPNAEQ